jgi:hypothetical protein
MVVVEAEEGQMMRILLLEVAEEVEEKL